MILQKEIQNKAKQWQVPPDTVDKDYILGHFLSAFSKYYKDQLVFKGGTCLRKCYIENYRFSEDLDFSSFTSSFRFDKKLLKKIIEEIKDKTGIQFFLEPIKTLQHNNIQKGFQVNIKYWGANHSKNQQPLPPNRWHTKIKLEVSTEEIVVLPTPTKQIFHPYSDNLCGADAIKCYAINEIVSEKLRALKQRSYTAPRDFYDLYYLTNNFSKQDWETVKPLFLKKMKHKNLKYKAPRDLITEEKLITVERAWQASVAHQITNNHQPTSKEIIEIVAKRIQTNLVL
ncbi:nucleotidyl transferase AbiEii/AbiGii toxin family protein [Lutibacter sp.]|uniref:nucleotidyl transferase AbiEii/AbiGii toxin family protein n=1 Tax=Lutibacter sp. TaxID=1925666 RepID=UPI0025C4454B|nr:nucleotidyl transferase AbiEii/AbiGii toxin family protein [Lutibacter sp.]MCF6168003.1 nucleotidyl transferase AbiEii/AbiGii toxin family protein [Lutibacter sp.]